MKKYIRIAWFLALASLTGFGHAASFDCNKASTQVEKLICSTDDLSEADTRMANSYRAVRAENPDALDQQRAWLRNTRNSCKSTVCLREAYSIRINELEVQQNKPMLAQALADTEPPSIDPIKTPRDAFAALAKIPSIIEAEWPTTSAADRTRTCSGISNVTLQVINLADLRVEYEFSSDYEKSVMESTLGLNATTLEHTHEEWISFNNFLNNVCR